MYFKQTRKSDKKHREYLSKVQKASTFINRIKYAKDLSELYIIFRDMTKEMDISFILNPYGYGMFRASCIENCLSTDIFLSDIDGIWTHTLNYWMKSDDKECVSYITYQFKYTLLQIINTYIKNEKDK